MRTDAELIRSLGTDAEAAEILRPITGRERLTDEAIRKWRENGIPWRYRAALHRFFKQRGERVPADFIEVRRPAA